MGRPRKSVEEHIRNGTYRPGKHGPVPAAVPDETAPAEVLTRHPSLAGRAAAIWDELVGLLRGILRQRDIPALIELCRWIERSERISAELDVLAVTEPAFAKLLASAKTATSKIAALTKQFGMTPADRARVRVVESGPPKAKVPTRPKTAMDRKGAPK